MLNSDDHDLLIEIRGDVKNLIKGFDSHLLDDKTQFKALSEGQEFLKKIIWGSVGAGTLVAFTIKLIFK